MQEALSRLTKGRTVLVIAHRLSTVVNADKICVLSQGKASVTTPTQPLSPPPFLSPLRENTRQATDSGALWSVVQSLSVYTLARARLCPPL